MNKKLKRAILKEFENGRRAFENKDYRQAFFYFERSHVLGQLSPFYHTLSHLWMLRVGFKERNVKEIIGQVFRIPSGFLGSIIGVVPTGNTGGSNVSPFKKMPIDSELQNIIDNSREAIK